ncbi:MAG: hypothetical protein ACOX9E_14375 [Lentisphaeria bacterium]|jgi:hypothetical protein
MIKRKITPHVLAMARYFPVVTIMGPRQSGKITLTRAGMTFDPSFANDLRKFLAFAQDCVNPTVLYGGDTVATIQGVKFDSFKNTCRLFGS